MNGLRKRFTRRHWLLAALIGGLGLGALYLRQPAPQPSAGKPTPEYGLVWFGSNGRSQKAMPGQANDYFNPSQPTIIFVHGWLPNQVGDPPTFIVTFHDETGDYVWDLAESWVEAGWNIGVFYWHPFADEDTVWAAEDKIWNANEQAGMRYRDAGGAYHTENMPTVNAADLFYETYVAAMAGYSGPEIRLAGHSLGNQMAVRLALKLVDGIAAGEVAANLLPSRLALLDPFWSPIPKAYLDEQETGTVIGRDIAGKLLPQGMLVEWYRSSLLTEATLLNETLAQLQTQVVYAELAPEFCPPLDVVCRHDAAWHLYFLSFGSPAPHECVPEEAAAICLDTGKQGPAASTTNGRLTEMANQHYYWVHSIGTDGADGRFTPQTDDDWFHRLPLNPDG